MENFEVAVEPGVLGLVALALEFGVPVDLDAEVVARLLPVHLAAGHAEQVLDTHLVSRRKLEQHHSSRHILGGQKVEIKTAGFLFCTCFSKVSARKNSIKLGYIFPKLKFLAIFKLCGP